MPAGADEGAAFQILAEPTALQARPLELIGVSPATTYMWWMGVFYGIYLCFLLTEV